MRRSWSMSDRESSVTFDELVACGWKYVVDRAKRNECHAYCELFFEASTAAETTGDLNTASALRLLGHLTGMMLRPGREFVSDPFAPMFQWSDSRSAIPDDFEAETLDAVEAFV